jgi:hypothetical protein
MYSVIYRPLSYSIQSNYTPEKVPTNTHKHYVDKFDNIRMPLSLCLKSLIKNAGKHTSYVSLMKTS